MNIHTSRLCYEYAVAHRIPKRRECPLQPLGKSPTKHSSIKKTLGKRTDNTLSDLTSIPPPQWIETLQIIPVKIYRVLSTPL
jgi:hypothetical protein